MAGKTIAECSKCGYPIAAEYVGQVATCASCGTISQAVSAVNVPDWLFWGGLGILAGVVLARSKAVARQIGRV